jgi:hypothetical protein
MADYKSCAWYQNGNCIRDDKSGDHISCADCEDYECRVVYKIEDLQERNEEMSVRKTCKNCKYYHEGFCNYAERGGVGCLTTEMERLELSDDAITDVLHDAERENDAVNHPNHYCKGGVECLDAIKAALGDKYEGFLAGNVLKYIYRYPDKNGVEDCEKARFYLDKLIEVLSNEQT